MTYTVLENTRFFGVLCPITVLGISLIAHSQNCDTTHSFKNLVNLGCNSILPQTPVSAQHNRGLFGVSFAAINPQSTVSAQANRGFSAGTFAAIGGAV